MLTQAHPAIGHPAHLCLGPRLRIRNCAQHVADALHCAHGHTINWGPRTAPEVASTCTRRHTHESSSSLGVIASNISCIAATGHSHPPAHVGTECSMSICSYRCLCTACVYSSDNMQLRLSMDGMCLYGVCYQGQHVPGSSCGRRLLFIPGK